MNLKSHVSTLHTRAYWATKRLMDIVGGTVALGLFSLPMGAVSAVVKMTSPGPVLFKQERVGLDGERFEILKFRTMDEGAEDQLDQVLHNADEPLFKPANDARVTRVGRFLRRYSLDELPQVINVVRGDMSLVGPRPQVPAETELYRGEADQRLLVKPGMTGLWQVSGRSDLSWDEALRLDLFYVRYATILDDLVIMARTIRVILTGRGAS